IILLCEPDQPVELVLTFENRFHRQLRLERKRTGAKQNDRNDYPPHLHGLGTESENLTRSTFDSVSEGIGPRFEKFLRPFAADRLHEVPQRLACEAWLVTEFRHQIAAMPFHPTDLVFVEIIFPARNRRGADFRKPGAGRGIAAP